MVKEGSVPFRGYRTWYRIVGEGEQPGKSPLVCLHGGPGAPHDYLEPLGGLARTGRRIVFYDQLGCGNSDRPHDPAMWTVPLFIDELNAVRDALGLDRIHLFGSSWGGMLAMEYALTKPKGLESLILASSPASMPQWASEANRLRAGLPADVQAVLLKHELANTTADPEYLAASDVYNKRHVCRVDPWPDFVVRTFTKLAANLEVYNTMNGPNEFHVVGTLKDWDIVSRLPEIRMPTLVTSGRYDEATPAIAETVHAGIQGSEWVLFEESSHMAFVEETARYLNVAAAFLAKVEASAR